jgi:hypothetical protein
LPPFIQLESGGEDWIEARVEGSWDPAIWPQRRKDFEEAKEKSTKQREAGIIVTPDGDELHVQPYGKSEGGGIEWKYICRWRGNTLMFRDAQVIPEGKPICKVELKSEYLMEHGGEAAVENVNQLLASLGLRRGQSNPTRIDVCVDLVGESATEMIQLVRTGFSVKEATGDAHLHEHADEDGVYVPHSMSLGCGIKVRLYCKARELAEKGGKASGKEQLLKANRWGVPQELPLSEIVAVRVEFEIPRKYLVQFGAETLEEWFSSRAIICKYLTERWFRLTREKPDRKNGHQARAELHPLWEKVVAAFASWTGKSQGQAKRTAKKPASAKALVMQGVGCMTSFLARCDLAVMTVQEAVWQWVHVATDEFQRMGRSVEEEIARKRSTYVCATGAAIMDPSEIPF